MSENYPGNHPGKQYPQDPPPPPFGYGQYPPPPPQKGKLPLILGIVGAAVVLLVVAAVFIVNTLMVNNWGNGPVPDPTGEATPSLSESAQADEPSQEATTDADKGSGGSSGIYPTSWGEKPFLPYITANESKTDEDVLADLKSRMRMDTFTATDTELLNVTKSFCYAYEKGDSWSTAAVEFTTLGDAANVESNYSNLAYNVNVMGYAGAHFYCPRYEADIKAEILEAQNK